MATRKETRTTAATITTTLEARTSRQLLRTRHSSPTTLPTGINQLPARIEQQKVTGVVGIEGKHDLPSGIFLSANMLGRLMEES
jgi:hypothetical protein